MKKIRGDKLIWVLIHIYMKMSQGNSLCLSQTSKNTMFFFFSFLFFLLQNQRTEGLRREDGTSGRWGGGGESG
jgi:hypothetical protein